jgi:transcriptional/translational regulatory protein YebC/TACO1
MTRRVLDVTAYTTFDYLPGRTEGLDWSEDGIMVLNVDSDAEEGIVTLAIELDPTDVDQLEQHADVVELAPEQARTLASTLRETADRVEASSADLEPSDDD